MDPDEVSHSRSSAARLPLVESLDGQRLGQRRDETRHAMKPSLASRARLIDESERDAADDTPRGQAARSSAHDQPSPSRPPLVRAAAGEPQDAESALPLPSAARVGSEKGDRQRGHKSTRGVGLAADSNAQNTVPSKGGAASREEERLSALKEVMGAKLLLQQRMRRSYGSPTGASSHRGSPIKDDELKATAGLSTVLEGSGSASVRSTPSASGPSTGSAGTVRASVPATPATSNQPLRTPSYPFPYIPGTPNTWQSTFHQPFTNLSPTVLGQPVAEHDTPGRDSLGLASGGSTPAANNAFLPPGESHRRAEDPRFPTPNLYDLVLQLNSEPGIEQWWTTVTNLLHDYFEAERATVVTPMDPTDIENVPWGLKATFNRSGRERRATHPAVVEPKPRQEHRPELNEPLLSQVSDVSPQKLHPERLRPRLESRHSYAGPGWDKREALGESAAHPAARPLGPPRTVTHAAGFPTLTGSTRATARRAATPSSVRNSSFGDPTFSSAGGECDDGPYAEVFPALQKLDLESRPLIEPAGVNRVLSRGRLVTVTRDYRPDNKDSTTYEANHTKTSDHMPNAVPKSTSTSTRTPGNFRNVFAADRALSLEKDYEEYEQHPTSPWAQSPAPSPAIRADEEENPFFATQEQQIEDSFNPTTTPKDYSQFGQVEAIGVDRASTVVHLPLIHPILSQPMQTSRAFANTDGRPEASERRSGLGAERMAPVAILSVLTSTVPYPHNLLQSLKLLGPHLATSLMTAQQFSSARAQHVTIRNRRTPSGNVVSNAPMTIETTSLEDIVNAEFEETPVSMSGSVTSPSEYSGHSKHSPASSIVGTPGWDVSTPGWASIKPASGAPAFTAAESGDNYFDARRRTGQRTGSNTHGVSNTPPPKAAKASMGSDNVSNVLSDDNSRGAQVDRSTRPITSMSEDKSSQHRSTDREHSPPAPSSRRSGPVQRPQTQPSTSNAKEMENRHSQLHSYGADVHSSFGLPSATVAEPRTPGVMGHARKTSYPEDMPPPSERLLRTIIDSVPVQIFTAEPETGRMTWVNSKFLVYGGHEPRQVLSEPWLAIHPEDRSEFMASWHRSLRTAQQLQQKVRLQRFDGDYRWFYVRAAPLKDKRQRIVHWIGTMMDFHEQHIAEMNSARQQETAASEAKYRALANSSPQVVFAANKKRGVTFCNTQWLHFSGQSEAQALGVGFMNHVHPDDLIKCKLPAFDEGSNQPTNVPTSVPPELRRKPSAQSSSGSSETEKGVSSTDSSPITTNLPQRKLSELASTGILKVIHDADGRPSYSTEIRLKSKDGAFRWHLVRVLLAEPVLQLGEDEETWYGTCTDINDHKTLERDLKETMDEKSRFLSNMSHEIRTPLNGITGMVNFLIDSSLTLEQMEHVGIIRASTEGLRGLINDILDLSKAEAGMIQLNMDWLYVRALIEEVNDLTSAMAIDKRLDLNYLVEEDVPAQVKGDRFRIRQILLNIVGNAIKFTSRGEVFVRCSTQKSPEDVELSKNEIYIKFEVIDTGRGFTDQEAQFLFKRFSQIDGSSTRQHGGTGLGLVISKQLAQLHGGDMNAKGVPGKGATFTLLIKSTVPSKNDQPPPPPATPGGISIPILPMSVTASLDSPTTPSIRQVQKAGMIQPFSMSIDGQAKPSPKFALERTQSPSPLSPDFDRESPALSSASSDPSVKSAARTNSIQSERSSASSYLPEPSAAVSMKLALPSDPQILPSGTGGSPASSQPENLAKVTAAAAGPLSATLTPLMYSILVVCPLKYSREATVQHVDKTLPKHVPHQITARGSLEECRKMIGTEEPVIFTHVVVVLQDIAEIIALMDQILASHAHSSTVIVIITDLAQRREIMDQAPKHKYYEQVAGERRLRFVFKPLKPSRFAVIFDPQKEREMSTDRNHDSAQQVAVTQKQVFDELSRRLGNKPNRVLLVEDNKTNQLVVLKFLEKVSVQAEKVNDGLECTERVLSQPHGYYSIILCDLHMPQKDGYQTCKEIRRWEKKNRYPHMPIIALSANVLGDVYQKCVDAGFNSYLTKPVDFKEFSQVLMTFMDPNDPSKPHEFMKKKGGSKSHGHGHGHGQGHAR